MSKADEKGNISMTTSLGFIIDFEKMLNYLSDNNVYMAQINNITVRFLGEQESTSNGKRQVFEIERKV